ncbi:MAG: patatin-like phospholipase family protein [Elusimicrobia bacterium]|nr:patatin-like phospholipase family protein [Elusimicrobiota bacterium]
MKRLAPFMAWLWAANAAALPNGPDALLREHLWRQVTAMPKGERPSVGVVLSAGATRGVAHVGVLQALENAAFPVDVVAGTSAGAVIGAFYSAGVPMPKLWTIREKINLGSGSNYSNIRLVTLVLADRLLDTSNMEKIIHDELGEIQFHQLAKPFGCVAMDLKTGEKIVFRSGPLAPAVRASMNLPGIFEPVVYRHRYLVDGGVVDYVPADVARLLGAEWVVASVTMPDYTTFKPKNVLGMLEQVIDIRGSLLAREQQKLADAVIEPQVGDIEFYATERAGEAMDKGVIAAHSRMPAIQEQYILFTLPRLMRQWRPGANP